MARFERRTSDTEPGFTTASLPDIVFMLLIFFMVSTVLREQNIKVRTQLPQAEALTKIDQKRLVSKIHIGPLKKGENEGDTAIQIDDALIENRSAIRTIMYNKLQQQPKLIASLKVDQESEMEVINQVQQELREAGALRINYSSNRENPPQLYLSNFRCVPSKKALLPGRAFLFDGALQLVASSICHTALPFFPATALARRSRKPPFR